MKNVNIMGVHQFLGKGGGGVTKNNIYEELPKSGGFAKNREEGVFEGGLIPRCTL